MHLFLAILVAVAGVVGLCVHAYFKHDVKPRAEYRRSLRKSRNEDEPPQRLSA